jgi:hypothetical protein
MRGKGINYDSGLLSAGTSAREPLGPALVRRDGTVIVAIALLAIAGCGGASDVTPPPSGASPKATQYLNSALDLMQAHSFYRAKIDWPTLRSDAIAMTVNAKAQTTADTYPSIRSALSRLQDHHSFLETPGFFTARLPSDTASIGSTTARTIAAQSADSLVGALVNGRFGYVRIPTFSPPNGGTSTQIAAFADTLLGLVRAIDALAPCGWVVDLRHNGGGNMWPMLAGIGPVLGEGTRLGSFLDATGNSTYWYYMNGVAGLEGAGSRVALAAVARMPYVLRTPRPPVALLTDGQTASSGEAITVAFRGRPDARSFGAPTYGVPTANEGYLLSDGAELWLMTAVDVDRSGTQYIDPIRPDQVIPTTAAPTTSDDVATAAMLWLANQPTCTVQ